MSREVQQFAARLAALEKQVVRQGRASRLSHASLEGGAIDVYDQAGSLTGVVGVQADGTTGVVTVNGPTPPTPTAPWVAPALGALRITWDGDFTDAVAPPLNLARIQVHVAGDEAVPVDVRNPAATIESAAGASVTVAVPAAGPWWVRLVAVSTSGRPGPASAAVAGAPRPVTGQDVEPGGLGPDRIAVGVDGNLVADPGFEGDAAAARIVPGTGWSLTPGRDTPKAITVTCTSPATTDFRHELGSFPATPGTRLWSAADVVVSSSWVGRSADLAVLWEGPDGAALGESVLSAPPDAPGRSWLSISGSPAVGAPPQTVTGRIVLRAVAAYAGTVSWDNVVVRPILTSTGPGSRAEVSPDGLRIFDAEGQALVSLVAGQPQYLTINTPGGRTVASIDQNGGAAFGDLAVAGGLSLRGEPLDARLAGLARGVVATYIGTDTVQGTVGAEFGWVELPVTIDPARHYRIMVDGYASPSAAGGEVWLVLRTGGTAAPTVTSRQLQSSITPLTGGWSRVRLEYTAPGSALGGGQHRLLSTVQWRGGPAGGTLTWRCGPTFPAVMLVEDTGRAVASTGALNRGGTEPTTPPVQRVTRTYEAAWSGTYTGRSAYSSYHGAQMLQGYYSSTNGLTASLVGFAPALATDLAGATVEKVEVFLHFEHWYEAAGGTAVLRLHGHNSRPATFSTDSKSIAVPWRRAEGKWVDITSLWTAGGAWRGVTLDPAITTPSYYGRAHGVGQQYPPQIRINIIK
ncbi:hypothetical protein ACN20G_33380 (plasmid) [Streptomyces sp. BI20]|uniref:hypothetical protein n=1 Tax=Streptomyces sp. BI20 TaxID=3403460 RepID=UPI003C7338A6